ncbi:MAG: hypothetical protein KDD56_10810, partial [Bdellovibrionales bacterium]|nr:hypothetical protein [Bdellovibrionales bacterium]
MTIEQLFPTHIYYSDLQKNNKKFNQEILNECLYYMDLDDAGHDWSEDNYVGGYTSYSSLANLNEISATFAELEKKIRKHLKKYISSLAYDVK